MRKHYNYKLIDPITDIVFYVGKAHDSGYRPKKYLTQVKQGNVPNINNWRLYCYIKYLLSLDLEYRVEYLVAENEEQVCKTEANLQLEFNPICNIAQCGEKSAMTGRQHSEETKKLMSEKAKGRKMSSDARQKMSVSHQGLIRSDAVKQKISIGNTGKVRTNEARGKYSKAKLGNTFNIGRPCSEETKRKIGLANRKKTNDQMDKEIIQKEDSDSYLSIISESSCG